MKTKICEENEGIQENDIIHQLYHGFKSMIQTPISNIFFLWMLVFSSITSSSLHNGGFSVTDSISMKAT